MKSLNARGELCVAVAARFGEMCRRWILELRGDQARSAFAQQGKAKRRLHDRRIEHGLQTSKDWRRRRLMTLSTSAGSRLLLGKGGRSLAQFVEQPRVLDGDDGLGGEVRD